MIEQPFQASNTHAPFKPSTYRVANRLKAFADAISPGQSTAGGGLLSNTLVLPDAGIVFAGTNCRAPLYDCESEEIAELTGFDVILMRFDPDTGAHFDIFFTQPDRVLRNYLAWRTVDGGQWLVPQSSESSWLFVTQYGIEVRSAPSWVSPEESAKGIKRMTASPLEKGEQ